ncbi:MAG: hypothetical protein Q7W56_00735 [Candidatus Latescibacteria bacterium]|nr:hypothetical protein [Candidatus Latescibacterota bacterium]
MTTPRRIPNWCDLRTIVCLLAMPLAIGCTRPPVAVDPASSAATAATAAPVEIVAWLDDDPSGPAMLPVAAHMIASARDDTTRSWLWVQVELHENQDVRLLGPGALRFCLELPDGTIREVLDEGVRVPLDAGANTFLNSASGPITIRPSHAHGSATCVPLLVRLPLQEGPPPTTRSVAAVPERWQRH